MKRATVASVALALFVAAGSLVAEQPAPQSNSRPAASASYYPERFDWQHRKAEEVGMDVLPRTVRLAAPEGGRGRHGRGARE
jgi:hypothetical protein